MKFSPTHPLNVNMVYEMQGEATAFHTPHPNLREAPRKLVKVVSRDFATKIREFGIKGDGAVYFGKPTCSTITGMDRTAAFIEVIRQVFPDLVINEVQFNGEGQFSDILILNHEIVFRFPRYASGIQAMAAEVHLLQRLRGRLPLAIPDPMFSSFETQAGGMAFMGYPLLPGEPLWKEKFAALADSALRPLAAQLAGFLQTLHTLPADEVGAGLPVQDGPQKWGEMYEKIKHHLFPLMGCKGRRSASAHFENFIARSQLHVFQPAVRHGDFGSGNILYLDNSHCASGVIDWSSAGVGDPATDIAAVSCFGQPFFDLFCASYCGVEALLERARFWKGTFALQEALHGFISGDQKAFNSGMADYLK